MNDASASSWLLALVWEQASEARASHLGRTDFVRQVGHCRRFDMEVRKVHEYAARQHSLGPLVAVVRVGRPRVPSVQEKSQQRVKSRGYRLPRAVLA